MQGKATAFKTGKTNHARLYIKLRNGAVYVHRHEFNVPRDMRRVVDRIKANGGLVHLTHWRKVA